MTTQCTHCGHQIYLFHSAGPWVHSETGAVECYESEVAMPKSVAKPEDEDEGSD